MSSKSMNNEVPATPGEGIATFCRQHKLEPTVAAKLLTREAATVKAADITWWVNPKHAKSAAAGLALNALLALPTDVVQAAARAANPKPAPALAQPDKKPATTKK